MRQISTLLLITACGLASLGCAAYRMGAESLYAPDIRTIYVPMIESDSYRRDLGERLTEAIVNEIELKTPYKVVGNPSADAVLTVHLQNDIRRTTVEDAFDQVRAAENRLRAEVTFVNHRRSGYAACPQVFPMPPEIVGQTSLLAPAVGQTVSSSQQVAIERLAQQIVGSMEESW
ncbi:LPS assembly lipoprotein LptE [Aeoliella sp. ICT_H6.2]|uniref:LPS assembly lipoprotein LptE n=1 Tax=Aeoliella straminimaris TaxID=2954799 RepID=A0A9X2F502_9BACT|nr:LPS assembly lipoprotein LptE [Aeoliella straminimaris]MCO6042347.1 LPS assembly lipoprotein LptE [Aeoliella straminimaris]